MTDETVDSEESTERTPESAAHGSDDIDVSESVDTDADADTDTGNGADVDAESPAEDATGIGPASEAGDDVPADLLDRVADAADEQLAREIAALRARITDLETTVEAREATIEAEREDAEDIRSRLQRKQADFQNFKRRIERQREQERERATEDLITRLLDVRDNLRRAVEQDAGTDIREGVESTLQEFDRVLAEENVAEIAPEPGDEVDPQRHEVLMRVDSDHPPETIAEGYRPGYEMGGKVLRPAQVTVSDGE